MLAQIYCQAETPGQDNAQIEIEGLTAVQGTQIRVEILTADGYEVNQTITDLQKIGAQNINSYQRLIAATFPITIIDQVQALDSVQFVRISSPAPNPEGVNLNHLRSQLTEAVQTVQTGSVTGQHVALMDADDLQAAPYNLGGDGIKIGVISDSWDCYSSTGRTPTAAQDAATGDVPNSVTVIDDWDDFGGDCNNGSDEIRAMLQVVYDVAPNATYAVASNGLTKVDMATTIDNLVTWGADIITNDVQFITEAMFQDDIVTQAIDDAYAQGVAFFTLSHNHRDDSWEGPWASSDGDNWLDFAAGPDERLGITPSGSRVRIILQWDQPYKSISGQNGTTDLWLGLYRTSDNTLWFSADWDNINNDPYEWFWVNVTPGTDYYVSVWKNSGTDPGTVKVLFQNSGDVTTYSPSTTASTLYGNSVASGAITIGGVVYWDVTSPYYYNSRGVTPILFDLSGNRYGSPLYRSKPDIVAPTGLNNTFFGSDDSGFTGADTDTHPNFWGTSSAAPAAAGIGALLLDANPDLTPEQLYNCLRTTADDVTSTGTGFDTNTGYGYIDSLEAYAACAALDYGDLPDSFDTTSSNAGPSHVTSSSLYLGSCIDSESDGAPDAAAGTDGSGGDDNSVGATIVGSCAVANDDEDGVTLVTPLIAGAEACVEIDAVNSTGGSATLYGWIDFNGDGDFDGDANEALTFTSGGTIANGGAINQQACFTVPSGATFSGGDTHMRFRLTTDTLGGATPWGGSATNGEVEDYYQQLACVGNYVFTDVDGSNTQTAGDTAVIGQSMKLVWGGSNGVIGTGSDDVTYTTTTDGSGLYSFCGLIPDANGDSSDDQYQISIDGTLPGVPVTADQGGDDALDSDSNSSGEAPVFTVAITNSVTDDATNDTSVNGYPDNQDDLSFDFGIQAAVDYGDLPDSNGGAGSFPTASSDGGEGTAARHTLSSNLYLGSCVDSDSDGAPDGEAGVDGTGGDDNTAGGVTFGSCAVANDDEDGVTLITPLIAGAEACVAVDAVNSTGGTAVLQGWIDFNGDGDFAGDANEALTFTSGGTIANGGAINQQACFTVPSGATLTGGDTHMRFRLSSAGGLSDSGAASDGEVEDYYQQFACVGNYVWSDLDGDGVQDGSESGLNGVGINLVWAGMNGTLGDSDDRTYTTTTATVSAVDGVYSFCGLLPDDSSGDGGDYRLEVPSFPSGVDLTVPNSGGNDLLDSDGTQPSGPGTAVRVASINIPNSVSLTTSENGSGDDPGNLNGYPDAQDDLSFDIAFAGWDYGDLPDGNGTGTSYPTTNTDGGEGAPARHTLNGTLFLGSCVDADSDGQPNATAAGDDSGGASRIDGAACADDENGVRPAPGSNWSDGTAELLVDVTGGDGCLNLWLDWGNGTTASTTGDGDFDAGDQVVSNLAVTTGTNIPVNFSLPADAANNATWYLRARLTPRDAGSSCTGANSYASGSPSSAGDAYGGEVEDYQISFSPTAVNLQRISASNPLSSISMLWLAILVGPALAITGILLRRRRQANQAG